MEKVGSQVRLPIRRAFQIAVQGIRIRLGRSLVTVSGVVLGIAFLMSTLTGQVVKNALSREREARQTVTLMKTLVQGEVGSLDGKLCSVAVFGRLSKVEENLLAELQAAGPAELRRLASTNAADLAAFSRDAMLLLVLGDQPQAPLPLGALTGGMKQRVVLDSVTDRTYSGPADAGVRREAFFGRQSEEQRAKLRQEARAGRVRTLWIVAISLLVTVIGISNALLMSVTERFREIGTMKCLGALSVFIRQLFLIESALIGLAGSVLGVLAGVLLTLTAYGALFGPRLVLDAIPLGSLALVALGSMAAGTLMAMVAAIYPANFASRMVPASALRSNV